MKRAAWNRCAKLATAIVLAIAAGTWTVAQLREAEDARRDVQEVARMTQKMKTTCIGRFLIDMPTETEFEITRPRISGLDISSIDESEADFQVRLVQREALLRATPDRLGGNGNVESISEVKTDNGVVGKIFVHGRKVTEGTQARGFEIERYRYEGVAIEALVHGKGMSFDISASDYDPAKVENLAKLVAKLVPNPDNQVPTGPGFCIDRAWFRDPLTAHQGEQLIMYAGFPNHPDMDLMLILAAGNKPDKQTLLQRDAEVHAGMSLSEKLRVSNLRAKPRTIDGLTGDELVTRVHEYNDAIVFGFRWEVNGTEEDVFIPHLSLSMNTGKGNHVPVPSSLTQDGGLALWDKILSSVRYHHPRAGQATPGVSRQPVSQR